MSYNLLLDTEFKYNCWQFINCKYEDGYLISTDKVFGIKQDLILPNTTKLYFRFNYNIDNISVNEVKIGIQNKDTLHITKKKSKLRKDQLISIVDNAEQEKISLHLIFESNVKINKVQIWNPLLVDLNYLNKSTWLKYFLDKLLKYREGYHYKNIYKYNELTPNIIDFENKNFQKAKIGSLVETKENIKIRLSTNFIKNNYYLIKLDYKEVNKFGKVYLNYGSLKSINIDDEQHYLIITGNDLSNLYLNIEANNVLPYIINLKHLLIINISKMKLLKEDIPYLPFI